MLDDDGNVTAVLDAFESVGQIGVVSVFGGKLTALRWPEKELVSVPAMQTYADPVRPFMPPTASPLSAQQANDDLLDIEDVRDMDPGSRPG